MLAAILIRALPLDLCLFATWLSEELPMKGKSCPLVISRSANGVTPVLPACLAQLHQLI